MNTMLSRIRPFLKTVRRALSFVWESSPSLAVSSLIVRVIQGLLPLLVLYLTKLLIDAVTEGLKTPSNEASMPHITMILGGLAGVAVASAIPRSHTFSSVCNNPTGYMRGNANGHRFNGRPGTSMLTQATAAKEVRLFDLGPRLRHGSLMRDRYCVGNGLR